MWLPAERLNIQHAERRQLKQLLRDPQTPKKLALRISIVMGASRGKSNSQLAQELAVSRPTVIHWRKRFEEAGIKGLIREPLQTKPRNEMAEPSQPRQLTGEPMDIVGVYVGPHDKALMFSAAASAQVKTPGATGEAIDLPLKQTKEYIRYGATTLFAALGILMERAAESTDSTLREAGLAEFLHAIERATPEAVQVHMIVDSRGTHEAPQMKAWFADNPRFHVHCTPQDGSWLQLARKWWFVEVNREQVRQRTLGSVAELVRAIDSHLRDEGTGAKPFAWKSGAVP